MTDTGDTQFAENQGAAEVAAPAKKKTGGWSKGEEELLRTAYGQETSPDKLARQLGRTVGSVTWKLRAMKLRGSEPAPATSRASAPAPAPQVVPCQYILEAQQLVLEGDCMGQYRHLGYIDRVFSSSAELETTCASALGMAVSSQTGWVSRVYKGTGVRFAARPYSGEALELQNTYGL